MDDALATASANMLAAIHEVLALGETTNRKLEQIATTPIERAIAETAKECIELQASVIRRLVETQMLLDEGLQQVIETVNSFTSED